MYCAMAKHPKYGQMEYNPVLMLAANYIALWDKVDSHVPGSLSSQLQSTVLHH